MARSTIWVGGKVAGYIDADDPPRPHNPDAPPAPGWALLFLLVGAALLVLFIRAANEPNPGDPDYVRPSSSQSQPQ